MGTWKDGKQNGKGMMVLEDGTKFEGEWADGQRIK
jgi:hypothetical protein